MHSLWLAVLLVAASSCFIYWLKAVYMEYMLIELLSALLWCDIAFLGSGNYIDHHIRHLRAIHVVIVEYVYLSTRFVYCLLPIPFVTSCRLSYNINLVHSVGK